jgi:hypothetical protein
VTLAERHRILEAQIATVVSTASTRTAVQQAQDLGVKVDRVYGLRAIARRRGFDVPVERGGHRGGCNFTSGKWEALEREMAKACERCGLRGADHVCLHGEATARTGVGWSYPSGGF